MGKAYLILENGNVFEGTRIGAEGETIGELVFTTGMGGYIETLTDPSYFGQIVLQTFPLIGNYGMISNDMESDKSYVRGYVVKDLCDMPENFRCEEKLEDFLKRQGIVGICGIDTREITKIIRETGVMNARITSERSKNMKTDYVIADAVKNVSCKERFEVKTENAKYNVALLDLGAKKNIIRELNKRACDVTVFPYDTQPQELLEFDGIMLSNGPGDPAENVGVIENIKQVFGKKPIFGICLGHQLLALANGAKTTKLKYGHRGVNQPVKDLETGRVYITSQNHGYAVMSETIPDYASISFVNANDNTCEGVTYKDKNAYSVQFHPEACSGPKDTNFLFDKFIDMLGE